MPNRQVHTSVMLRSCVAATAMLLGAAAPSFAATLDLAAEGQDEGLDLAACAPLPPPMTHLDAARRGADGLLQWDAATDASTDHYNVWKVINQDRTLIPTANKDTAAVDPNVVSVCLAVPRAGPICTDSTTSGSPVGVLFYQVRGACADGTEGTAHPF